MRAAKEASQPSSARTERLTEPRSSRAVRQSSGYHDLTHDHCGGLETSSKAPPARRAGSASCRLLAGWLGLVAGARDTGAAPAVVTAFTQP